MTVQVGGVFFCFGVLIAPQPFLLMLITPEQFRALAPAASDATLHALFAETGCKRTHLQRAIEQHGLDAPHVAAQFLAVCSLLSNGFTNFATQAGEHVLAQSPDVWIWSQARRFDGNRSADGIPTAQILLDAANDWEFDYLCLQAGVTNAHGNRAKGWRVLRDVCAALGVACELEKFSE